MSGAGRVYFVGAGPGDPDLLTLRAARLLEVADIVLYDALVAPEVLARVPARAERINVGKRGHEPPSRPQDEINALIVESARRGLTVVRLKGGDPFVFGRGGEEASACVAGGIPFEVVPGVSSALAVPAYAGIPVTDRRHSASFAVVTGHKDPTKVAQATRWRALATAVDTVVILMGLRNLPELSKEMIEGGLDPMQPAAAIMRGTFADQRVVEAPLRDLADRVREAGLEAPSVIVVGEVVRLRETLRWREQAPLFGLNVLVTRAREQAEDTAAAVREAGGQPIVLPLVETLGPDDSPDVCEALAAALRDLDRYDAIVFSSSNAVEYCLRWLDASGARDRIASLRAKALCLGPRTATAARAAGFEVALCGSGGGTAEALLHEIEAQIPVAGQRFLLPRSDIGRNVLRDGLRAAGARVDAIAVYRTRPVATDRSVLNRWLAEGTLDVLTFTSPSTARAFCDGLDEAARAAVPHCVIAAIGATTAASLRAQGLAPDVISDTPDARALVAAVAQHVAAHGIRTGVGPKDESPRGGLE